MPRIVYAVQAERKLYRLPQAVYEVFQSSNLIVPSELVGIGCKSQANVQTQRRATRDRPTSRGPGRPRREVSIVVGGPAVGGRTYREGDLSAESGSGHESFARIGLGLVEVGGRIHGGRRVRTGLPVFTAGQRLRALRAVSVSTDLAVLARLTRFSK